MNPYDFVPRAGLTMMQEKPCTILKKLEAAIRAADLRPLLLFMWRGTAANSERKRTTGEGVLYVGTTGRQSPAEFLAGFLQIGLPKRVSGSCGMVFKGLV